jgi:cell division protein FtsW (lipid II flippase)
MTLSRRREIILLTSVAFITTLGMALVCAAVGDSPVRATRGAVVVGVLLLVALLMDLTGKSRDRSLLPIIAMLCGLGLIVLWRLDPLRASKQIVWMMMGAGLMLATYVAISDVRRLARVKYLAGVGAVALLVATMIWGQARYGARLWLDFGIISLQPGEIAKILMAIFLAGYVAERGEIIREVARSKWGLPLVELRYLGPIAVVVLLCLAIFSTQHDLGAALVFFGLALSVMFLGTGRRTYVGLGLALFVVGALLAVWRFPYVHRRMVAWVNPWSDPADAGLQALQAMFALGEGGLIGTGLGLGMPYKMPVVESDLIFGAVGEELGLAGTCAVVLLFALLVFCGLRIDWRCRDRFGMLLAAGLTTTLALQALVIIGGVIRVFPLTGVTLPFVSYGGTSVIINFIALGLLLAVSRDCTGPPGDAPGP